MASIPTDYHQWIEPDPLVRAIIKNAGDRSSFGDELHFAADTANERYHLGRGRANLLRSLDLPSKAKVLQLSAHSGAVTRYLGEQTESVLALESSSELAGVAALRTSDLSTVEISTEQLSDLPQEPAFNLVIAIGIMEWVLDDPGRVEFLGAIRKRLLPGGILCLAVDNQFGVRNLAGAPDSRTLRRWDAVEGYPHGSEARALHRNEIRSLLEASGFSNQKFLTCFPDYRHTRTVMDSELITKYPKLAVELPQFPSSSETTMTGLVDEYRLWSQLVYSGLGTATGNSFFVLAGSDQNVNALWPENRLAVYFNTENRASQWCTRAEVRQTSLGPQIFRNPLIPKQENQKRENLELTIRSYAEPYYQGVSLVELLVREPDSTEELLAQWTNLVHQSFRELGTAIWDLVPHNVVATTDRKLYPIDLEWEFAAAEPSTVISRGLLLLAESLASQPWQKTTPNSTVRDLAGQLGSLIGLNPLFVDVAVDLETRFQALRLLGNTQAASVVTVECRKIRSSWEKRLSQSTFTG